MNTYTFTFDTCETPYNDIIAQPFSVFVNFISCCIILYFLYRTTQLTHFLLLLSVFAFELSHLISHATHIKGPLLVSITNFSFFLINISFLYYLYSYIHTFVSLNWLLLLISVLLVDIYFFFYFSFVFSVFTQLLLFSCILFYYYSYFPKQVKRNIFFIIISAIIIYLAILNEKINCKKMLALFPGFPFHIIVEILGIIPIYLFSSTFYNLK